MLKNANNSLKPQLARISMKLLITVLKTIKQVPVDKKVENIDLQLWFWKTKEQKLLLIFFHETKYIKQDENNA